MSMLVVRTEIKKYGNSFAVRIPKKVKDIFGLHDVLQINIFLDWNKVMSESEVSQFKASNFLDLSKDISLFAVVKKIVTDNRHSGKRCDGGVVGGEIQ